ncbi:T9SS type A sorting domain-containing protein, partial [candidate division KSB1 bacterium]
MKTVLAVSFLFALQIQAQTQWQNPLPQGNVLLSLYFKDAQSGFAIGLSGTILKTVDGGKTWSLQSTDLEYAFYSMHFLDQNDGLICGADRDQRGIILRTTDGGSTWALIDASFDYPLYSIDAFKQNSYAVGGGGIIVQSSDRGLTWNRLESGTPNDLWSVCFADENTGYVAGDDILLKTTNKGTSWSPLTSVSYPGLLKYVWFFDADEGYFFGQGGTVLKTTNGGVSFLSTGIHPTFGHSITSAFFTSRQVGFACGEQGRLFKTTNAGESWTDLWNPGGLPLYSVFFISATEGFVAGVGGHILHTINAGDKWDWSSSRSGFGQQLKSISFVNQNVGYAVGGTAPYGSISEALFTKDKGNTWHEMTTGTRVPLNAVCFLNESTGYAVGYEGTIIKTTDGGNSWSSVAQPNWQRNLRAIFFVNENKGFVVGGDEDFAQYNQVVLKTTDAGLTWSEYESDWTFTLNSVFFADENLGFACGNNSNLIKTTDGGATWRKSNSGIDAELRCIFFTSKDVGYCVGEDARIYKTTNQGVEWAQQVSGFENRYEYDLNSVYFVDANTGYAVGGRGWDYGYHQQFEKYGLVLKTSDGGATWTEWDCATWNNFYSIAPVEKNSFILCGDYASLIKVTNDEVSTVPATATIAEHDGFFLAQNYPNPFNRSTTIQYNLPVAQYVELKIYDTLGRDVITLVDESQAAGSHKVQLDSGALSTGLFFYRLRAG